MKKTSYILILSILCVGESQCAWQAIKNGYHNLRRKLTAESPRSLIAGGSREELNAELKDLLQIAYNRLRDNPEDTLTSTGEAYVLDLIRAGANIDAQPHYSGHGALHLAIKGHEHPFLNDLLKAGADPEIRTHRGNHSFGDTPLDIAINVGNFYAAKQLLEESRVNPAPTDETMPNEYLEQTPLNRTMCRYLYFGSTSTIDLAALLLHNGADPNAPYPFLPMFRLIGETHHPMSSEEAKGLLAKAKLLKEYGAIPHIWPFCIELLEPSERLLRNKKTQEHWQHDDLLAFVTEWEKEYQKTDRVCMSADN